MTHVACAGGGGGESPRTGSRQLPPDVQLSELHSPQLMSDPSCRSTTTPSVPHAAQQTSRRSGWHQARRPDQDRGNRHPGLDEGKIANHLRAHEDAAFRSGRLRGELSISRVGGRQEVPGGSSSRPTIRSAKCVCESRYRGCDRCCRPERVRRLNRSDGRSHDCFRWFRCWEKGAA